MLSRNQKKRYKNNIDLHILLERITLIYVIIKLIEKTIELIN